MKNNGQDSLSIPEIVTFIRDDGPPYLSLPTFITRIRSREFFGSSGVSAEHESDVRALELTQSS